MINCASKPNRLAGKVGVWTPILAPLDCDVFWMQNRDGAEMLECTDDNPGPGCTHDVIKAGVLQYLPPNTEETARFPAGSLITNLAASGAPSAVVITFIL